MTDLKFSVSEIRSLTDALFGKLQREGLEDLMVEKPNYWTVFFNDSFQQAVPELVVGDVTDDIEDLRGEIESDVESIWHGFHHLSGLMNLIAYAAEQGDLLKKGVHQ